MSSVRVAEMTAHVQWLSESIGVVRVFEAGKKYGDPFTWVATVERDYGVMTVYGVMRAPTRPELRALLAAVREAGCYRVRGERGGRIRTVTVPRIGPPFTD